MSDPIKSAPPDLFVMQMEVRGETRWLLQSNRATGRYRLTESQYTVLRNHSLASRQAAGASGQSSDNALLLEGFAERGLLVRGTAHSRPWEPPSADHLGLVRWALSESVIADQWPILPDDFDVGTLRKPVGCYVCLKREGRLRGCFGSTVPFLPRLADEIVQNAVAAAMRDDRFLPLTATEVDGVELSVDVVDEVVPVRWPQAWDARQYGLQLAMGDRVVATLLPGLEGVRDSRELFELATEKAGETPGKSDEVRRIRTSRVPNQSVLPLIPYLPAVAESSEFARRVLRRGRRREG